MARAKYPDSVSQYLAVYMPDPESVSAGYLLGWMAVLYTGFTSLAVSHQSWGAELAAGYNERSRLFGWREMFLITGLVTVLAIPAIIERGGADAFAKVDSMAWFVYVLLPITVAIALWVVPEPPEHPAPNRHRQTWRPALAALASNRSLRKVLAVDMLTGLGTGITGALYIFVATYVFELGQYASLILLAYFAAGFVFMPAWMFLSYRIGKERALAVALVYQCSVQLLIYWLAEPGRLDILWIYTLSFGLAFGAAPTLLRAMMADLTDQDELESREKRSGLLFGLLSTTNKIGSALSVGFTYLLLDLLFGFQPGSGQLPAGR